MPITIVRKLDELGRVVLPAEIRSEVGIKEGTPVNITFDTDNGSIIITKFIPCCSICGEMESLIPMEKDVYLCQNCLTKANLAAEKAANE